MFIYYLETDIANGLAMSSRSKHDRVIGGRTFDPAAGHALFKHVHVSGGRLQCWACGLEASCYILRRHRNEMLRRPTLDLFGGAYVLFTRDHIIPRSMGGMDLVANLRVGCATCNEARGSQLDTADRLFMETHPELIKHVHQS